MWRRSGAAQTYEPRLVGRGGVAYAAASVVAWFLIVCGLLAWLGMASPSDPGPGGGSVVPGVFLLGGLGLVGVAGGGYAVTRLARGKRERLERLKFNPAPGWPPAPEQWRPWPGWRPDDSWPEAPAGWQFWTRHTVAGELPDEARRSIP